MGTPVVMIAVDMFLISSGVWIIAGTASTLTTFANYICSELSCHSKTLAQVIFRKITLEYQ
jgi:hypothetical protein